VGGFSLPTPRQQLKHNPNPKSNAERSHSCGVPQTTTPTQRAQRKADVSPASTCLRKSPQPDRNASKTQNPKHNRPHKPLVVVVYRGFPATTTIEK